MSEVARQFIERAEPRKPIRCTAIRSATPAKRGTLRNPPQVGTAPRTLGREGTMSRSTLLDRTLANLHHPGYAEIGDEPDVAAELAETGFGHGWDWQRDVPQLLVTGFIRVTHYEGQGLREPRRVGFTDYPLSEWLRTHAIF